MPESRPPRSLVVANAVGLCTLPEVEVGALSFLVNAFQRHGPKAAQALAADRIPSQAARPPSPHLPTTTSDTPCEGTQLMWLSCDAHTPPTPRGWARMPLCGPLLAGPHAPHIAVLPACPVGVEGWARTQGSPRGAMGGLLSPWWPQGAPGHETVGWAAEAGPGRQDGWGG